MTDLKIAHVILRDAVYNGDQLIFELELSKIKDTKLRLGLLIELLVKSESYKCDRKKVLNQLKIQYSGEPLNSDVILEYQEYFVSKMSSYMKERNRNNPSVSELEDLFSFFSWLQEKPNIETIVWSQDDEISQKIKSMSPKVIEFLKSTLLKQENFEEVMEIDKILQK